MKRTLSPPLISLTVLLLSVWPSPLSARQTIDTVRTTPSTSLSVSAGQTSDTLKPSVEIPPLLSPGSSAILTDSTFTLTDGQDTVTLPIPTDSLAATLPAAPVSDSTLRAAADSTLAGIPDSLKKTKPERRDTLIEVQHALRIGIDLAAPLLPLISGKDKDSGWLVMADYRLTPKLYAALDFGHAKRTLNSLAQKTDVDGWYARAGINYSLLRGIFSWDDMLFAGAKLGYSKYNRRIYDTSVGGGYWNEEYPLDIQDNPSALWLDLSVGVMVRLFNNFYLSMQGGYDLVVSDSDKTGIGPLTVPGLGQVYNKSTAFSFSYSLAYRIPLYKKTHKVRIRERHDEREDERRKEMKEREDAKKKFTPAFNPSELLEE